MYVYCENEFEEVAKILLHVWWLQSGLPSREVTPGANTLTLILLYLNLYLLFPFDDY